METKPRGKFQIVNLNREKIMESCGGAQGSDVALKVQVNC